MVGQNSGGLQFVLGYCTGIIHLYSMRDGGGVVANNYWLGLACVRTLGAVWESTLTFASVGGTAE